MSFDGAKLAIYFRMTKKHEHFYFASSIMVRIPLIFSPATSFSN